MARLFFRQLWHYPFACLDSWRYQGSLGDAELPAASASYKQEGLIGTWLGRRAPWGAAFVGALPFLLFGLAYLLEGFAELGGQSRLAFKLLVGSPNHPALILTPPVAVYFLSALGLLIGVMKGFPRWSYAYLGLCLYFGWYYSNGRFNGVVYSSWAWLPLLAAILLGLLFARSLQPLGRLFQGVWNDWTRLSFAFYAFGLPILTVIFFDQDWGALQLYGLFFDTILLAAMAVAYLRSPTIWGRVLSLQAAVPVLVVKGLLGGWFDGRFWPAVLFSTIYFGFLLLPALIGLLRRGVVAFSSR
jgi:hypothetical protein